MNTLVIIGASGHGKVVADAALATGPWQQVVFLDAKWPSLTQCGPWSIVGSDRQHPYNTPMPFVVAIGNATTRLHWIRFFQALGWEPQTVIHPHATVSPYAQIGAGTVICAQAVVGSFSKVGQGCIVNTSATLDHDCVLEEGVHLAPGAHVAGDVFIGRETWIGIGASVIQGLRIGPNIMVGAGSAVVGDLQQSGLYVGIPARRVVKRI